MQKTQIRILKTHYGDRWRRTVPSLHEKFVLSMLQPGTSVAFDCVTVPAPNLTIDQSGRYNNVLALNLPRFKYKTLYQLSKQVQLLQKYACHGGLIFVSFNYQFVNYNRLREDFSLLLENWINDLAQHNIVLIKNLTKKLPSTNSWGDCFFIFSNHEIPNNNLH